ncbi:hypothetical protein [Halalkalicoccus sp. NIPERK01]|uniref:hypothetical protein n=1 Tax=Halalkalicoccus sp. NIPERK01 TaxID=3053469 RepID=UPI00256EC1D5|nr:hypothetical protein [Halalkalicoccus sp. NIPERK01]MDL5363356.1 hypothetical protein [Halalkalicoccus sp. NIPERK01]
MSDIIWYYSLIPPSAELVKFVEEPINETEDILEKTQEVLEEEGIDENQLPTDIHDDFESARDLVKQAGEGDVKYYLEALDDARKDALNAINTHLQNT